MANPWTKKNPLMSMWLSAAHKAVGGARGQAVAATKRQVAVSQADSTRKIVEFWSGAAVQSSPKKKTRR